MRCGGGCRVLVRGTGFRMGLRLGSSGIAQVPQTAARSSGNGGAGNLRGCGGRGSASDAVDRADDLGLLRLFARPGVLRTGTGVRVDHRPQERAPAPETRSTTGRFGTRCGLNIMGRGDSLATSVAFEGIALSSWRANLLVAGLSACGR